MLICRSTTPRTTHLVKGSGPHSLVTCSSTVSVQSSHQG
jgi:hypothetical protein